MDGARDDGAVDEAGAAMGDFTQGDGEASARMEERLLRADAAIRRSAAELQRAEATRRRAQSVHERVDAARQRAVAARNRANHVLEQFDGPHGSGADERGRLADRREAEADDRERMADRREAEADDRERMADWREAEAEAEEREHEADGRELSDQIHRSGQKLRRATAHAQAMTRDSLLLGDQEVRLRARAADLATRMAEQAEVVASYFEHKVTRGDRELSLAIARTEKEVARIERQNAARLLDFSTRYVRLDTLPRFPGLASNTTE